MWKPTNKKPECLCFSASFFSGKWIRSSFVFPSPLPFRQLPFPPPSSPCTGVAPNTEPDNYWSLPVTTILQTTVWLDLCVMRCQDILSTPQMRIEFSTLTHQKNSPKRKLRGNRPLIPLACALCGSWRLKMPCVTLAVTTLPCGFLRCLKNPYLLPPRQ